MTFLASSPTSRTNCRMPFLQIGYKRIHYADLKPEGDLLETFIFMHGLGSSQDYYYAVTAGLVAKGFRCIIFDNTGAARSPYTFIEQSVQTLADDVIGILDALKVPKAVFCGHSMCGWAILKLSNAFLTIDSMYRIIGAHLAAERSDRIRAAVLIGPIYPNPDVAPVFQKRIATVEEQGMQPMADSIPSAAVGRKASSLVKAFIRELLLGQTPEGYCSNCRVIANARPPNYSRIEIPVLILAGEDDKSAPLEGCKNMYEEMRSSRKKLAIMSGVGHWHCLEAPDEVVGLIEAFYHNME